MMRLLAAFLAFTASSAVAVDWLQLPFGNSDTASSTTVGTDVASDGSGAVLRLLDKNTNRIKDFTLKSGASATSPLSITLRRCVKDVQGVPGQDVAWVDVVEPASNQPLYSGWMFNFYPDVATLEHPRFDLRLMGCSRGAGFKPVASGKAKTPTVSAPSAPQEDSEAPVGDDPNYVEGLDGEVSEAPPSDPLHELMDGVLPERAVE